MPLKCSVPGCRTNYRSKNTKQKCQKNLFRFPDDLQRLDFWRSIIPGLGDGYTPKKYSRVCSKHFLDKFLIERYRTKSGRLKLSHDAYPTIFPDAIKSKAGKKCELSRNKNGVNRQFGDNLGQVGLSDGAYNYNYHPTLFPSAPIGEHSLSQNGVNIPERKGLDAVYYNGSKTEIDNWASTDEVTDFLSFCKEAENYLDFAGDKWIFELDKEQELESVRFSLIPQDMPDEISQTSCDPTPLFTVTVFADLYVKVHSKVSGDIPESSMSWIFGKHSPPVMIYWSQFVTILCQCSVGFWIDRNDFDSSVCINDLHQLPPLEKEEDNKAIDSFGDARDVDETHSIHTAEMIEDTAGGNDNARLKDKIQQLTHELYSVTYQRNILMKKMKNIQDLASINLDIISLSLIMNPEGKEEIGKVHRLVQTVMSHAEEVKEMNAGLDVLPVWIKENSELMKKGDFLRIKFPSFQDILPPSNDFGETNRKLHGGNSDGNVDVQSLVEGTDTEIVEVINGDIDDSEVSVESSQPVHDNNNGEGLMCEHCQDGRRFSCLTFLQTHQRLAHNIRPPTQCEICGKECKNPSTLQEHMTRHSDEKPFQCAICGSTFKCMANLQKHEKTLHTKARPYPCSICDRRFKRSDQLKQHVRLHSKVNNNGKTNKGKTWGKWIAFKKADNLYHCEVCDKGFKIAKSLQWHLAHHSDALPYQCTSCDKAYKWRTCLQRHMLVHEDEEPYECSLCGKKFKLRSRLKSHQLVHTDQGEFECDICEKRFKWRKSLQNHRARHKKEEGQFQCSLCLQQFKQKEDLARHEETHKVGDKVV